MREQTVGKIRPALLMMLGAVHCSADCVRECREPAAGADVLRGRQGDCDSRAMGATRSRLIKQLLLETILLSLMGGRWVVVARTSELSFC